MCSTPLHTAAHSCIKCTAESCVAASHAAGQGQYSTAGEQQRTLTAYLKVGRAAAALQGHWSIIRTAARACSTAELHRHHAAGLLHAAHLQCLQAVCGHKCGCKTVFASPVSPRVPHILLGEAVCATQHKRGGQSGFYGMRSGTNSGCNNSLFRCCAALTPCPCQPHYTTLQQDTCRRLS